MMDFYFHFSILLVKTYIFVRLMFCIKFLLKVIEGAVAERKMLRKYYLDTTAQQCYMMAAIVVSVLHCFSAVRRTRWQMARHPQVHHCPLWHVCVTGWFHPLHEAIPTLQPLADHCRPSD